MEGAWVPFQDPHPVFQSVDLFLLGSVVHLPAGPGGGASLRESEGSE